VSRAVFLLVWGAALAHPGAALQVEGDPSAVPIGAPAQDALQPVDTSAAQLLRTGQVHPEARSAIDRLRSPYCPGLMLEVCTSSGAAELRDSIDAMARAGLPADSIVELVIADYGEEWRAVPLREGTGWWAWLMPPIALLLGLAVVAVVLVRRRRVAMAVEEPRVALGAEEEEKVRQALADLDESEHPEW
jgi:cytochrome c-type biogenesis protein CcmH/NrfF